jgi:hypothetical protein
MKGEIYMNEVGKIVAGIGLLIGIYLFLSKSEETARIISTFASNTTSGIKVLQGRG